MNELELKYGCNPNQKPSRIFMKDGSDLPIEVLNGKPGFINFLDAFNSWQLVKELKEATGLPAAASFKHVSPAGAAVGHPLTDTDRAMYFVEEAGELSPIACAYIRARGADRLCSYGDWAALSDVCDADVARYLAKEVSDGIIAPGYTDEALEILKTKRKGSFNVVQIDPAYVPAETELKDVFGITFEQGHNNFEINEALLENVVTENKEIPAAAKIDMIVALITLKYTQSNSVCYVKGAPASRAASTARAWRATRPTTGGCASIRRCWACPSWRASVGPTATTPSTCTSPTSGRTCWPMASGSACSPSVPNRSPARRRRPGSPR